MNILLLGEYSRLHNSLKEGLENLGHKATVVSSGDGFKKYNSDIYLSAKLTNHIFFTRFLRKIILRVINIDISFIEIVYKFYVHRRKLINYDIVQLINTHPIRTPPWIEKKLLAYIFRNNKSIYLLACGDDYNTISYYLKDNSTYNIMTPFLENNNLKKHYYYSLKYLKPSFKKLHDYVFSNIKGVIPSDFDYVLPIADQPLARPIIPNPINIDRIKHIPLKITKKIVIFHGVNISSSIKKGNNYFHQALELIKKKYPEKVEIITTFSLPYKEYIQYYQKSHILLDQIFCHDQGYNALEAMAAGKVVFTGAGNAFKNHYKLKKIHRKTS